MEAAQKALHNPEELALREILFLIREAGQDSGAKIVTGITQYVPGAIVSTPHILTHLIPTTTLNGFYYHPHLADEKTEAQGG